MEMERQETCIMAINENCGLNNIVRMHSFSPETCAMTENPPEAAMASENPQATMPSDNPYSSSHLPTKRKHSDTEARIVWPPVVIIENTLTHYDHQQGTWKGLENEEIRSFLKTFRDIQYGRVIALYGRKGNRGKCLVIFPSTPLGYIDAQAVCECLERDKHGRRHWHEVSHSKDPCGHGRVTPDGKKILYGYLATEHDMLDADHNRKIVKRWSMESYVEKVLEPLNQSKRDKEEAMRKREELAEEAKRKLLAVEHNKVEAGKVAAEFKKINQEIQEQKKQEEELEAMHRRTFEQRKSQYEQEKLRKLESFKEREKSIRERLNQNNIAKQNAVSQYEELAKRLQDGIDMERKNHELRIAKQQQMEMLEHMELDSMLQAEMEKKLAELEKKFQEKQLKLQEQHNGQIMKSRAEMAAEKEKFLQSKLTELEKINNEVKEAKTATEREIESECIICMEDFVKEKLERALFLACGHANVCSKCARLCWKQATAAQKKVLCPTCQKEQGKKFTLLPPMIYS